MQIVNYLTYRTIDRHQYYPILTGPIRPFSQFERHLHQREHALFPPFGADVSQMNPTQDHWKKKKEGG